MRVTVKKWGNSAAVRLPASVVQATQLKLDEVVEGVRRGLGPEHALDQAGAIGLQQGADGGEREAPLLQLADLLEAVEVLGGQLVGQCGGFLLPLRLVAPSASAKSR